MSKTITKWKLDNKCLMCKQTIPDVDLEKWRKYYDTMPIAFNDRTYKGDDNDITVFKQECRDCFNQTKSSKYPSPYPPDIINGMERHNHGVTCNVI